MPVAVNTLDKNCQLTVNIMFWRINDVMERIGRSALKILKNPYKFTQTKNMTKLQNIFYDTFIRAKTPIYKEIYHMFGKPNHPTISYFRNRIIEVWKLIAFFLMDHVKSVGEENLFENSNLKFYLLSLDGNVIRISREEHEVYKMFTEDFDAENYIKAVEQR